MPYLQRDGILEAGDTLHLYYWQKIRGYAGIFKRDFRDEGQKVSKAYAARHRKVGLCEKCPEPVSGNTFLCKNHREIARRRSRRNIDKTRQRYLDENRCVKCSAPLDPDADGANKCCITCRGWRNEAY